MWLLLVCSVAVVLLTALLLDRFRKTTKIQHSECMFLPRKSVGLAGELPSLVASSILSLPSGSFYIDYKHSFPAHLNLPDGLYPATIFHVDWPPTKASVEGALQRFRRTDDVFDNHFLSVVIFTSRPVDNSDIDEKTNQFLRCLNVHHVIFWEAGLNSSSSHPPAEGPYIASKQSLMSVFKLFPDTVGAFVASLIQHGDRRFSYANASSPNATSNLAIAVPSRLYYPARIDKPLNGLRVAVKDNIDTAGAITYASCRHFGQFYCAAPRSAPAVQLLIDLGAVIIGKLGMSEFADAEAPTGDFVDFHAPFNPRGDGARTPGGSSFGSGAAAGAYDWIDITIGTDTGGSIRQPAAHQAVYGLRPSRGVLSVEGTVIIHRELDAIGILSRNLALVSHVAKYYFTGSAYLKHDDLGPIATTSFIYPSHLFPIDDPVAQKIFDDVSNALEVVLNVKRRALNFNHEWGKFQSRTNKPFEEYFAPILYDYINWGQYHERLSFREGFRQRFSREPYVNPVARLRWQSGSQMSLDLFKRSQGLREQFEDFMEYMFGDNSVMLYPFLWREPKSRDIYRLPPSARSQAELGLCYLPEFQSPYAGQPELVFPVGQLPVHSKVSGREELYGVSAALTGSKGMDHAIVEITQRVLQVMGVPDTVLTGPVPFKR